MPIQFYSQTMTSLGRLVWQIDGLDRLLKVADQATFLYIEIMHALKREAFEGFSKLHIQLGDSIGILGVAQGLALAQELTCPNKKGFYFFQHMSWQKSLGRVFLACYSFFRSLKWVQKLGFIEPGRIGRTLSGNLTILWLATECSYIFYRVSDVAESIRTKNTWKALIAAGKIFVSAASLAVSAWKTHNVFFSIALTAFNLVLDCCILQTIIHYTTSSQ